MKRAELEAIDPMTDQRLGVEKEIAKIEDSLTRIGYWEPLRPNEAGSLSEVAMWLFDLARKNGAREGR